MNPGSDAALDAGCTCPVLDNGHGRGAWTNAKGDAVFWLNNDCPLHGERAGPACSDRDHSEEVK